ncbi:MAG: hypothetical protein WC455_22370 [Dehalococcoidia bacterium]
MHMTDIAIALLRLGDDRKRQWDKLPEAVQRAIVTKVVAITHDLIQSAYLERGRLN